MAPTRADLERLTEGQVLDGVELTRAEAVALNATQLVSVQPRSDGWQRTPSARCGDLTVRVQPKVGALQVLRLLARAHGVRRLTVEASLVGVAPPRTSPPFSPCCSPRRQ